MKPKSKSGEKQVIDVVKIQFGRLHFYILGTTALVINRLAEKARQELLMPGLKKNRAGRETTLKHHPIEEFRSSLYRSALDGPTRLYFPGSAFASAMCDCAMDVPGSSRAQMERLTRVVTQNVNIYGIPKLFMCPVRTAGPSKTPDIRTRAIVPQWACEVEFQYVRGLITERSITNLLAAAGVIGGVGDGRGKMGFGQFALVKADNPDFKRILKTMGRVPQDKAIEAAESYDHETEELLSYFKQELIVREKGWNGDDEETVPLSRSRNNEPQEELV